MASHARNTTEPTTNDHQQLDVLGDECARTILIGASERPLTAKELTALTDCSSATVYRRINTLLELGLLDERIRFDSDTKQKTAYETAVSYVGIGISADGIAVTTAKTDDSPGKILDTIEQLPFAEADIIRSAQSIDVRIELPTDASSASIRKIRDR